MRRYVLRFLALGYLLAVLLGPLSMVFFRAFDKGTDPLWKTLSDPNKGRMVAIERAIGGPTAG